MNIDYDNVHYKIKRTHIIFFFFLEGTHIILKFEFSITQKNISFCPYNYYFRQITI